MRGSGRLHAAQRRSFAAPGSILVKSFLIPTVRLGQEDVQQPESFLQAIDAKRKAAPAFYEHAPLVLDLGAVEEVRVSSQYRL